MRRGTDRTECRNPRHLPRVLLEMALRPTRSVVRSLALLALISGCASPQQPRSSPAGALPALPRSSIAAILAHRDELALAEAQVRQLEARDDQLARENAPLRARLEGSPDPSGASRSGSVAPVGSPPGRPGGGARHGGTRDPARPADPIARMDDNDTRAYLEIEANVLTEAQRPRAQEIASEFRSALYDRQHPGQAKE
jgi:hypothetical protein